MMTTCLHRTSSVHAPYMHRRCTVTTHFRQGAMRQHVRRWGRGGVGRWWTVGCIFLWIIFNVYTIKDEEVRYKFIDIK